MKLSNLCYTARDKKNQLKIAAWCFAWALSWVLTTKIVKSDWQPRLLLILIFATMTLGFGLLLIWSYRKFLREADELLRKIELEALAFAVGASLVVGSIYELLHSAFALDFFSPFQATLLIFAITYSICGLLGYRRFL